MNKIIQKNQNGFTLIEIMIAVTVLAIGILGIAKMQIAAINGNASARKFTEANFFAQSQIETLITGPFADINNDNASSDDPDGYTVEDPQDGYTVKWKVTDLISLDGADNLKKINVIVEDATDRERANIDFAELKVEVD